MTHEIILFLENNQVHYTLCHYLAKKAIKFYPNSEHNQCVWLQSRLEAHYTEDIKTDLNTFEGALMAQALYSLNWYDVARNFIIGVSND